MDENKKIYDEAVAVLNSSNSFEKLYEAIIQLETIEDYEDSSQKIQECKDKIEQLKKQNKEKQIADAKDKEHKQKEETSKKKKAKILSVVAGIICVSIVVALCIIIPQNNYKNGVEYLNNKDYRNAYQCLRRGRGDNLDDLLGQATENFYNETINKAKQDFTSDVISDFELLGDYADSSKYVQSYNLMQKLLRDEYITDDEYENVYECFNEIYLEGEWKIDLNESSWGHKNPDMYLVIRKDGLIDRGYWKGKGSAPDYSHKLCVIGGKISIKFYSDGEIYEDDEGYSFTFNSERSILVHDNDELDYNRIVGEDATYIKE